MRLLSWNLHGFVGRDGVFDPARSAEVMRIMNADIAALQEVDLRHHGPAILERAAAAVGEYRVEAPALGEGARWYGQALVSRFPVANARIHDLSFRHYEPRRLIEAWIDTPSGRLRVLAAHLGLNRGERRKQFQRIAEIAAADTRVPTVMTGDLNEWRPGLGLAKRLLGADAGGSSPLLYTFPARLPLLPLDRVLTRPRTLLRRVHAERRARDASDHLPVLAELDPAAVRAATGLSSQPDSAIDGALFG